ncbi:hypothetical protein [Mycobacteroides chelonae]|uniref:Gp37-like protein n=1 Tax=Mycobacteroides chelonae TaxID=1774 RepID=UPI000993E09D|nr:hypothetical protein [Mycobacteroides chelonae]
MARVAVADPATAREKLYSDKYTAANFAEIAAAVEQAAPSDILVELYTNTYKVAGECGDYMELQVAWPRNAVGTGSLVLKGSDPLAPIALTCHETVVPVTVTVGHLRWSGRIKKAVDKFGDGPDTVLCELEGDYAWLYKICAFPNFLLPIQVQFPNRGVAIGGAISVIKFLIATQAFRIQSGMWDLVNNLGSLNLDWRTWFGTWLMQNPGEDLEFQDILDMLTTPIYVVPTVGIFDTSPVISINWRMDKLADIIDQEVKDNGLSVEVNLWMPGEPQPHPTANLRVPTIVVDVKDRMGVIGPTGTFFDGILRVLVDLQDSVFGEILKPFLNPDNEYAPDGVVIAPRLGVHFVKPWCVFSDHPQSGIKGELAHHHPLAHTIIAGGRSPKWMNDLINATLSWLLDSLMIVIGMTGVPSNLLDGMFNDVLLAFQMSQNFDRRVKLGPYGYPEFFVPTGHAAYNIDMFFALKRAQWETRGYISGKLTFDNGYPYEVGRDVFPGALASVVRRGMLYTDYIENVVLTDTRRDRVKVEVQLGDGKAEEAVATKLQRKAVKFQEALNILTMAAGQ